MIRWEKHGTKWLEAIDKPRSRYQVWRRGSKWAAAIAHWGPGLISAPQNLSMHDTPAQAMAACLTHQQQKRQEAANG